MAIESCQPPLVGVWKNVLDKYCDVGLCGDVNYTKDDVFMIAEDSNIVAWLGK